MYRDSTDHLIDRLKRRYQFWLNRPDSEIRTNILKQLEEAAAKRGVKL